MRYLSFTVPADEWERWGSALPLPSFKKSLTSAEGLKIQIAYELNYRPSTSGDWYFIADLRRSYQVIISGATFHDHLIIEGDGWDVTGHTYKLQELKRFPMDERKYPAIMRWASSKKTFRSKAFVYGRRLKYEGLLTYPAMMGALVTMNTKLPSGERMKVRTLERLTHDILVKSDEWAVKLSKEALHACRSDLGIQRGRQLQVDKEDRVKQIKEAISSGDFTKPSGAINQKKIADYLGVHRNTIKNLLPFVLMVMVVLLWIRTPAHDMNAYSLSISEVRDGGHYTTATI